MSGTGHIQIEKYPLKVGYMPTSSNIAGDGKKTGRLEKNLCHFSFRGAAPKRTGYKEIYFRIITYCISGTLQTVNSAMH